MNPFAQDDLSQAAMTIAETAAHWWVRHDAGALTADERQSFDAWYAESAAHREAYARTQHSWGTFEEHADSAELRALRTAALGVTRQPRRWPRWAAASVLCAAIVGLAVKFYAPGIAQPGPAGVESALKRGETYATARNERSTITLSDGSTVTLNRDTSLEVAFTPTERKIHIARGQAFFEVAKNPRRPFVVAAADRVVTALGTQFDVRVDSDRVEVVLLEGSVAIDRSEPSLLERLHIRKAHVVLSPGERLVAALGEPQAVTNTDARRATSWRQGWVSFENESVGDVVAELNRYSDRQLTVPDESVRKLRLSGVFRVGQPDRFVSAVQELLPVKALDDGHGGTALVHADPGQEPVR